MSEESLRIRSAPVAPESSVREGSADPFFIVAVGASAGGLEALEAFFKEVPRRSGNAYVVLQHLSPDFKSRMDELLGRQTDIPIHQVHDGMHVERDAIYLIPPKKEMIISDGRLLLTDKDPSRGFTLPIDRFFRSLATDRGPYAVAVVLSGTGSDGSRGVRDIHGAGGLVIAQDVESARFDGMPRSACDTGVVDLVLPPEAMAAAVLEHSRRPPGAPLPAEQAYTGLDAIFQLLRAEYGIDFAHYKPSTVGRRIERRLSLTQQTDVEAYARRLSTDPGELNALYRDLLIGVTRFFRDKDAFDQLERLVIPSLLSSVPPSEELRVWCAGCATGEEAYSVAILLHEQLEAAKRPANVKIFATDVHRASLELASQGTYHEEALAELGEGRLERYFTRTPTGYTATKELRQLIVFARHNVMTDAPFTRLDLITCRNMLIYLQPPAQKKVLSLFHFALKTGGCLFLGPSETPGDLADEFEPLDKHWRMYRKRRDVRLPPDLRMPLAPRPQHFAGGARSVGMGRPVPDHHLISTYDRLLTRFMPPSLLVDERYHLMHSFGGAERFVRLKGGRPSVHIFDLLQDDLKTAVSGALQHAEKAQGRVRYTGVRASDLEGSARDFIIVVEPVYDKRSDTTHFLVTFETVERSKPPEIDHDVDAGRLSRDYINSLEEELRFTKENLQATIEELETSNEELQATNEELVASNEELQSTNEELHSVNEELYTVNAEHQRKISELSELTDDMDNLLHSTELGVIFLDRELTIRRFTPRMADSFRLLNQDLGRPFDDFARNVDYPDLLADVRRVLNEEVRVIEREITGPAEQCFLLRILPYRQRGQRLLGGVVLTLIDIGSLRRAELNVQRLSAILEHSDDGIVGQDLGGKIIAWNQGATNLYGHTREEAMGQSTRLVLPDDRRAELDTMLERIRYGDRLEPFETERRRKDGSLVHVSVSLSPIHDDNGRLIGVSSIARDITKNKRAEQQVRQAVRQREDFLAMLSHELRNPLAAVLSASRVLQLPSVSGELKDKARQVVARQAQHMARLLDDLLDVSRMRQDKIEMRKEPVDLRSTVEEVLETVRPSLEAEDMRVDVQLADEAVRVMADPARVRQLQVNLLTNAIKHSAAGSSILLCVAKENDEAVLRVRDEGEGIPPSMLETIFEPFTQIAGDAARDSEGLGLGLALVRSIVKAHGGQVSAHSEGLGRGTEVVVRFPLSDAELVDAAPATAQGGGGRERRLVLVEDEDDARDLLASLLEHNGFKVATASNGAEGIATIREHRPSVALVDIGLPEKTGYEVARAVREELGRSDIFLIALTGYGQQKDRDAVLAAGFNQHLVKPVQLDVLLQLLSEEALPEAASAS